jgi:hypothetical protein
VDKLSDKISVIVSDQSTIMDLKGILESRENDGRFAHPGCPARAMLSCSKDEPPAPAAQPAQAAPAPPPVPSRCPAQGGPARPNLVLVTLEATRADRLGCYGDPRRDPGIDRSRERARSSPKRSRSPADASSHVSILTGLYPPAHGVRDDSGFKLLDAATTLPKTRAQGMRPPRRSGRTSSRGGRLNRSTAAEPEAPAQAAQFVVTDAIETINRIKGRPFFVWVRSTTRAFRTFRRRIPRALRQAPPRR